MLRHGHSTPWSARIFFACLGLLVFILPIPETIALRHTLLLGSLLSAIVARPSLTHLPRQAAYWLLALTCWLLIQALAISASPGQAFEEMQRQWLPAFLCAVVGILVVPMARQLDWSNTKVITFMTGAMLGQALFALGIGAFLRWQTGLVPEGQTLLIAGKLEVSFWNNLLLTFLAIDALSRKLYSRPLTSYPSLALAGAIVLLIASNLFFNARNGVIGAIGLIGSLSYLVVLHERKQIGRAALITITLASMCAIMAIAYASYLHDPRWKTFGETAEIAWQIDQHQAWLEPNTPYPVLASGETVELSAYQRISWIRAGLGLIADYPLGLGYGRHAFGEGLRLKYGTGSGHSHSGLIDWTLATGIPGLMLWLGLMASAIYAGARCYLRQGNPLGLLPIFVVIGFNSRMLFDSVNRDHMLMIFFILLGMLLALPGLSGQAEKDAANRA